MSTTIGNQQRNWHCVALCSVFAWAMLPLLITISFSAPAPDSLRGLIQALQDKDEKVRAKAAASLEKRGREATLAVPDLLRALEDESPKVRGAAARALYQIQGKKALTPIVTALKAETDPHVRFLLVTMVMQWGRDHGSEAKAIIPALIETMKLDSEQYASAVESSWIGLIIIGSEAVPALVELAKDKSQEGHKRASAINVLERIGPGAKKAIPTLIELLGDSEDDIASDAADALGRIGSNEKDIMRSLAAFGDRASSVRGCISAAYALSRIDPDNKSTSPLILKILKEGDSFERARGAGIARRLGARARETIPALVRLLDDPEEYTRAEGVEALGAVAPQDKVVSDALRKASRDPSPNVREKALAVTKRIHAAGNKEKKD